MEFFIQLVEITEIVYFDDFYEYCLMDGWKEIANEYNNAYVDYCHERNKHILVRIEEKMPLWLKITPKVPILDFEIFIHEMYKKGKALLDLYELAFTNDVEVNGNSDLLYKHGKRMSYEITCNP